MSNKEHELKIEFITSTTLVMNVFAAIPYLLQTHLVPFCDGQMLGRLGATARPVLRACGDIKRHTSTERCAMHVALVKKIGIETQKLNVHHAFMAPVYHVGMHRPTGKHRRRCTWCSSVYKIQRWYKSLSKFD